MAIDCDADSSGVSVKCWKWAENTAHQQKAWDSHGAASCFGTLHSVFLVQRAAWHELLCFLTWECARWLQQSEQLSHTFHAATCFPEKQKNKKKILAHSRLKSGSDLNLHCDFIHNNRYHTTAFGNMFWLWPAQSFLQRYRRDDLNRRQDRRNVACEPCRDHLPNASTDVFETCRSLSRSFGSAYYCSRLYG